jgi:hypothetical protein
VTLKPFVGWKLLHVVVPSSLTERQSLAEKRRNKRERNKVLLQPQLLACAASR